MKKILSLILALALVMSLGITAFAAGDSTTANGAGDKTITVTGTYTAGQPSATKVSVDITWDAMNFTYTAGAAGEWNPEEHAYAASAAGSWSTDTKTITVTNHSNAAVTATLSFAAAVDGITGTFDHSVLNLPTAEGTAKEAAPTASAEFGISGAAITKDETLGTITVAIATN